MKTPLSGAGDRPLVNLVALIFAWIQGILGVFMLLRSAAGLVHGIMAVLLVLALCLTRYTWDRSGGRIFVRLVTAIVWLVTGAVIATLLSTATSGWETTAEASSLALASIPTVILSWLSPAVIAASNRGGLYDRILALVGEGCLTGCIAVAAFSSQREILLVSWDNDVVRYIWFAIAVATLLLAVAGLAVSRKTEDK